jgi:putative membrane protein
MSNYKLALAATGILVLAGAQSMAALSPADRQFASAAASGGQAEVALGQLAQQNGGSAQVRQFGQRMVTDHTEAYQELKQIAAKEKLQLPTRPDSSEQAVQQRLSKLKGAAFDSAYTQDMVKDHQQVIAAFQKEAQSGQDPDLKAYAQKTLPTLQEHLQMAESIESNK